MGTWRFGAHHRHYPWSGGQIEKYRAHLAALAMKGKSTDFEDLLPPSALSNLMQARKVDWIERALIYGEVACNVDQSPAFQLHAGKLMPCILASITHMLLGVKICLPDCHPGFPFPSTSSFMFF